MYVFVGWGGWGRVMGELNEQKQALIMGCDNNLSDIGYPDGS